MRFETLVLAAAMLSLSATAQADYLGCVEPSTSVYPTVQFNGASGAEAFTSVSARVFDPDDTTTPTATPAMTAVDGTNALGLFRGTFSTGASPTTGTWTIRYQGTSGGNDWAATDTLDVKGADECEAASAIAAYAPALEDGGRLENVETVLTSLCQAPGRHFTISGTPTSTEFDTDLTGFPDDSFFGNLNAYVWIQYADGFVGGGRISDYANTSGHITISSALVHGAPAADDEGCLSVGINP